MIVYRLSRSAYAHDLTGRGAELSGGRWNSRGVPMLYTSDSRALCTAEIAVHVPLGIIPDDYQLVTIELPDDDFTTIKTISLPVDWRTFPNSGSTQKTGDKFIADNAFLALKVPSAVVQGDFNYLINPRHKSFSLVKILRIEPYAFDERLFMK